MRVLFVQPFGMEGGLGSSQIFRSLIANAPCTIATMVYGLNPPKPWGDMEEIFIRERPCLGRIERSRLAGVAKLSRAFTWQSSQKKMHQAMSAWNPGHIHAHIHGTGFIHAVEWCQIHKVPFSACVHDDIRHLTSDDPWKKSIEQAAANAWRQASSRFVISPEIGMEYSRRYGAREWIQVTDGVDSFPAGSKQEVPGRLHLYFAGGMNVPYEPNFLAVQQGLKKLQSSNPEIHPRFLLRGGRRIRGEDPGAPPLEPLPFAPHETVLKDLNEVDVLYLPLSIDPAFSNFAKFSLSTKMVSYLASGLPIFYHGPEDSAAYRLLSHYRACAACFSNDPDQILDALRDAQTRRSELVENALRLAREKFHLPEIRNRFWSAIQCPLPNHSPHGNS